MGSLISRWWWGGEPGTPHPISGLSRRDIYDIQRSWAPVYYKAGDHGIELFRRLFKENPEEKSFFKSIQNTDEATWTTSHAMRAHVINLMSSIHMAAQNLDTPEVVVAMMTKLGDSHRKRHIDQKHFEVFRTIIMNFLANDMKLNDSILASWDRFIDFMYKHIFQTLNANCV